MLENTRQKFCNYLVLLTALMDYWVKTLQLQVLCTSVSTRTQYRTVLRPICGSSVLVSLSGPVAGEESRFD